MNALRRSRDHSVQLFLDRGLEGTLYVTLSADDLLDGDLYWEATPLAFVAKRTVLLLDETVATLDPTVLVVCLRELKALGFRLDVTADVRADVTRTEASTSEARVETRPRWSLPLPA